jgi:hypothetical protein
MRDNPLLRYLVFSIFVSHLWLQLETKTLKLIEILSLKSMCKETKYLDRRIENRDDNERQYGMIDTVAKPRP